MKSSGKPKSLKQLNTRVALDLIRASDTISVADVSDSIHLSKTTVKKILDLLAKAGIVLSAGKGDSTDEGGKKPELYRFNIKYGYSICLHVTPEDLIAVTTDLRADITYYHKEKLEDDRSLKCIIDLLVMTIRRFVAMKASTGEKLIGIAIVLPGLVDSVKGISIYSPHYPNWGREVAFTELLLAGLGEGWDVPIAIDNANRYQAVAEREKGIAAGRKNFVVIDALNEGLGAGIVLGGEVIQGAQSISGEIGHMTLDPYDGFPCICGHKGCFEAMASARRILGLAREAAGRFPDSLLARSLAASSVRLDDVCAAASQGDPLSLYLIDDVARWFLIGLSNIIMVNDPELIVIQGAYVKAGSYFLDKLREGLRQIGLPDVEKKVSIEYSRLGEERGVLGAAALMISDFFSQNLFA
ncbi:MAG: ROK family transcriptional regulator [Rectinemataceae bacterium]|jgi:predicted NBD/HSP70 family sugar kinase